MPTIRIENRCDDDIIITVDGKTYNCDEDKSVSIDNCPKGLHEIIVTSKSIPIEIENENAPKSMGIERVKSEDSKIKSHVHLSTRFSFESMASRCNAVITKNVEYSKKPLAESIIVSYKAKITGAKNVEINSFFPTKKEKRKFRTFQFADAFFPVGLIGTVLFLVALFCLSANFAGAVVMVGTTRMTMLYSTIFLIISIAILIYFFVTMAALAKTVRKYTAKKKR